VQPRNLSHVAIGVRDMDRSIGFYRDVVGLDVTFDGVEEFRNADGEIISRRRGVYLRWDDDPYAPFVVLDQPFDRERTGAPKRIGELGLHHFGFWVDDVEPIAARARAADVDFFLGPADSDTSEYGEPPGSPMRMLLLHDPDGNVVQFDQRGS
jgi:catechol 2,3-dioxygenase-like lactoylglutathione lyase family enzyme